MADASQDLLQEKSCRRLILIDGSSYLFRAYHALPPLTTRQGFPTQAIRGVLSMIKALQKRWPQEHMFTQTRYIAVFDAKGKTFRHQLYPAYKANRQAMPEDLAIQIAPLQHMIRAMGMPLISLPEVEADDVIATLAEHARTDFSAIYIASSDKDMAQLVDRQIALLNSKTHQPIDADGVMQKYGVKPTQMIDYLTLTGDKSDNVPGVDKVGPKTAAKWLQEYGDLDNLLAHAGQLKGKVAENLLAQRDLLPLSKQLVTIQTNVPLPFSLQECLQQPADLPKLLADCQLYEFKAWAEELADNIHNREAINKTASSGAEEEHASTSTHLTSKIKTADYQTLWTEEAVDQWLQQVRQAGIFALDTETTSLDVRDACLVGVAMAIRTPGGNSTTQQNMRAVYIPCGHDYSGVPTQISRESLIARLKQLLAEPEYILVGQNIQYDAQILASYQITLRVQTTDTMLMSYVYNPTATRHDLNSLARFYLQHQAIDFTEVAGKGNKQICFSQVEIAQATTYAAEDADLTLRLYYLLQEKLSRPDCAALRQVLESMELPLSRVLTKIEQHGVLLDAKLLKQQSIALATEIAHTQQQAYKLAGQEFNLDSPKQLQAILYDRLGIKPIKKTPKGQASTAESVLAELAHIHPLPACILTYRSLAKLKSTYTDKLPQQIHAKTGRVHTHYHQAITATGRLSSSNPNLQNIPIRTTEGRNIRAAFIAPEGYKILSADYSQIELRIMAHMSQDAQLLQAFLRDQDVHQATAAEVFGLAADQVNPEQRRRAKAINFGLIYGMSAFGLAKQLHIGRQEAQSYIDTYFQRYPGVRHYMEQTRKQAAAKGYVATLMGRRLYLPEINAAHGNRRAAMERTAINAPLQGTAADLIKMAMIHVDQWLHQQHIPAHMIMQVHDELVFEVREDVLADVSSVIREKMSGIWQLAVPLKVDLGIGKNWQEAH